MNFLIHFSNVLSEKAFCETIGSIMNNHSGKGQHLRPVNFNKVIFLGPTFMSEKLVEEVYQLRKKDYLYKETSTGELATHYTHLVDKNHGAAIRTYRAEQELKSRLPRAFWE